MKVTKDKRRFSMKYQIMSLCIGCVLIGNIAVGFTTLPRISKEVKVSTEAHMNDFVVSHSEKMRNALNNIDKNMISLVNASNRVYDALQNKLKAEQDGQSDLVAEQAAFDALSATVKQEMDLMLEKDPNTNAEIYKIGLNGNILNSSKEYPQGTKAPEGEYEKYKSEDDKLRTFTSYDESKGELEIVFTKTLYKDGVYNGIIVYKTNNTYLNNLMNEFTITKIPAPRVFMMDQDGLVITHVNQETVGTVTGNTVLLPVLEAIRKGTYNDVTAHSGKFESAGQTASCSYVYMPETDWVLGVNALDSITFEQVSTIEKLFIIASAIVGVVLAIGIVFIAGAFTKPMVYISQIIGRIAGLDFTINVNDPKFKKISKKGDEIGDMSRSVEGMIRAVKENLQGVNDSTQQVNEAADQLKSITTDINEIAGDTSAITEELSASMEEATASTNVITSDVMAIKEKLATIKEKISESANATSESMRRAEEMAANSFEAEKNTRATFDEIKKRGQVAMEESKATTQINELAKVIMDIADQTSLLALNASIEAARAGESGRGFAVVADEIGNLAQQSSSTVNKITAIVENVNKAVSNITECLSDSQNFVEENVYTDYSNQVVTLKSYSKDTENINQTMNEIDSNTKQLFETIRNMTDSIEAINQTVQEASIGVNDIAERNNTIGDLTAQSYEMVNKTNEVVKQLETNVDSFKL